MAKDATAGTPASSVNEGDYEVLLTTLSASALGRAFLAEFARRSRAADTDKLLAAIARLEALAAAQKLGAPAPAEPATAEAPVATTGIPDVTWDVEVSLPAAQRVAAAAASESPPPETAPAAPPTPPHEAPEQAPSRDPLTQLMALSEDERLALFS